MQQIWSFIKSPHPGHHHPVKPESMGNTVTIDKLTPAQCTKLVVKTTPCTIIYHTYYYTCYTCINEIAVNQAGSYGLKLQLVVVTRPSGDPRVHVKVCDW